MSPNPRILVADNNYSFGQTIKTELDKNGFNTTVCFDGDAAWKELNKRNTYDLCLLNYILPRQSGIEILLKTRCVNTRLPILFIADQTNDNDVIHALKAGGDGWLPKPISIVELIYRIRVFLKRSGNYPLKEEGVFKIGKLIFNYSDQILTDADGNEKATLTKKATEVLKYFSQKPNTIVTREELLYVCWGKVDYFKGRSLDVYITKLRKILKDEKTVHLETIHNIGFRFNMSLNNVKS